MRIIIGSLCIISLLAAFACSSPKNISRTNCLGKEDTLLNVRWGEVAKDTVLLAGWKLDCCGIISSYDQKFGGKEQIRTELGNIKCKELIHMLNKVKRAVLKIQVLNAPGDTSRFVEFNSPYDGVQLRFVWNPKYNTQNSEDFIAIYDTLDMYRKKLQSELSK